MLALNVVIAYRETDFRIFIVLCNAACVYAKDLA